MHSNLVLQAIGGHNVLPRCESCRSSHILSYTNAVVQAVAGRDGFMECGEFRAPRGATEVDNLFTHDVVPPNAGVHVFRDTPCIDEARDSLQRKEAVRIVQTRDNLRLNDEDGEVRRILATEDLHRRNTQLCCSVDLVSSFETELMSSANGVDLVQGASPSGVHNVDEQPLCSSEIMPGVQRNLQASKGGPQSGVAGPQTLEIIQDRGRSPSTDSVPLTELFASRTSGAMFRNDETKCPPRRATGANPVCCDRSVLTADQRTIAPTSHQLAQPCESAAMQVQLDAKEKPRKRRYKPKILSETPKVSLAKKLRVEEGLNISPTVPINFDTISPTVLRMKNLARLKWAEGTNKRAYVKRKFMKQGKLTKAASNTCVKEREEMLVEATELKKTKAMNSSQTFVLSANFLQYTDHLVVEEIADAVMVEHNPGEDKEQKHLDSEEVLSSTQTKEFSDFHQKSPFAENPIEIHETPSWPLAAASQENFNCGSFQLAPPPSDQGSNFMPDMLVQAFLRIPGNVISRTEIQNVLNPVDHDCATNAEEVFEVCNMNHCSTEDLPSTPRGAFPFVSVGQNLSFIMPPSSPLLPQASDWNMLYSNEEYESSNSATTTRRALNFDTRTKELQVGSSDFVKCYDADGRKGGNVLIEGMQESISREESPQHAAYDTTSCELQITDTDSVTANYAPFVNVSFAKDLSDLRELCSGVTVSLPVNTYEQRLEEELQIVAYDEGSKKMVVYKDLPQRKRRLRYKPKVDLDLNTVKMFKTLTIKGSSHEESERNKASWEECRQQWQNRAHQFISIMRQVQGNRAFSRWKGSVMDSVGGAFLTQNVSDFLSSNAFMALRARFPARPGTADEETHTPLAEAPPPVEQAKFTPLLQRPSRSELKNHQSGNQNQGDSSVRGAALLSHGVNKNICVDEVLPELVEMLSLRLKECHIDHKDHALQEVLTPIPGCDQIEVSALHVNNAEKVVVLRSTRSDWNESEVELFEILDMQASETTTHRCASPHSRAGFSSHEKDSKSYKQLKHKPSQLTLVEKNRVCSEVKESSLEEVANPVMETDIHQKNYVNDAEFDKCSAVENHREAEQIPSASQWNGKNAVIQEKFANVLQENVTNLSLLGKEKILAATLRLVLGKHQTATERNKVAAKAFKNTKLRPGRNALRKRTDNYRYRQTVSFRLLRGEARANWEAGFVMKSQKDKWEPLRARIVAEQTYSRDTLTEDCVDWNAVQQASVHEVADVIKNRGQHNALAGRLKAFLDRVHRDQNGVIDLEWIRKLPPEDAKAFLLSFRGVGLKSVECIRLLCLHHPSFPVDTNVGRIAVRLGWVPLEPLPEETQLHLLELYPIQSHIQQYMWPRLCTFDQQTLYELHYHMITFGKVFCTKSKPNCNACPLRSECKHYASSYASAKLLLKWPEKPQNKQSTVFALPEHHPAPQAESVISDSRLTEVQSVACLPIIEEPCSPEPCIDNIPDIEENPFRIDNNESNSPVQTGTGQPSMFSVIIGELRSILDVTETTLDLITGPVPDDFDELSATKMRISAFNSVIEVDENEEAVKNIQVTIEKNIELHETMVANMDITEEAPANSLVIDKDNQEDVASPVLTEDFNHLPSQELILLPPCADLAPAPKLKNVQRLRTVHYVYELPDNHPLLFAMDEREPDDPCFYLLAIWSPDEVPATMPKFDDDDARNPFASCDDNHLERTVRGTLLIPCKTAMRGWFPLNGTYFQVNEVFADHTSSLQPISVPRTLLWSLRRRFVYFSTAVSNLFKDMSLEEIRCCFQKGYVCLRAFDLATRQPKILAHRLHQSGAKIVKAPVPRKGKGIGRSRNNAMKGKK